MRSRGQDTAYFIRDSITKCKIFVLNSHHIFDARDLMADWGWGFTNPQPLPNPILSRAKGNFQLAIQKKETEVSLRLTNFVLHMYKQLTSEQRSQIFALLQKEVKRKEIALLVGCSQSTMSKNSTFAWFFLLKSLYYQWLFVSLQQQNPPRFPFEQRTRAGLLLLWEH